MALKKIQNQNVHNDNQKYDKKYFTQMIQSKTLHTAGLKTSTMSQTPQIFFYK